MPSVTNRLFAAFAGDLEFHGGSAGHKGGAAVVACEEGHVAPGWARKAICPLMRTN